MSDLDCTHLSVVPGNADWMPHPDPDMRGIGHPDFVAAIPFVRFDPATGTITERGSMAKAHVMRERLMQGGIIPGEGHWTTHYVDLDQMRVRSKRACPARLDGSTLTCLPVPCRIEVSNPGMAAPTLYPCSDASLALAFDHAGTWTVRVLSAPYLPGTFTVTTDV